MHPLRPIPKMLLTQNMVVREPTVDGFGEPREIKHVRFERSHSVVADAHRSDEVSGTVYVDACMSDGAFEIPAGSRVEIDGVNLLVAECKRLDGADGRIHHWELVVR